MMILFTLAVMIGTLLLIIPGLILMVSLLLCFPTALFDRQGPGFRLTESHRLVWGNWWRTAAILSVGLIIARRDLHGRGPDRRRDRAVADARRRRRRGRGAVSPS